MVKISDGSQNWSEGKGLLVDSGATAHVMIDRQSFISLDENYQGDGHFVEMADGSRTPVEARGNAVVECMDSGGQSHCITLTDALYIPKCTGNIFSVQSSVDRGMKVTFDKDAIVTWLHQMVLYSTLVMKTICTI